MSMWQKLKFWDSTLKEPEWGRQVFGGPTVSSGMVVNSDTALNVSAVFACVRILAETIASLPVRVYEKHPDGTKSEADHPLNVLLRSTPNDEQTAFELREFMMVNLGLQGNAYNYVARNGRGQVVRIDPLKSRYMKLSRDGAGKLTYDYQEPGNSRLMSTGEVWRVAGIGSDGVTGLSPIGLARESIGLAIATERHGGKLFSNGTQVPAVFEHPGVLSEEAYARLKGDLDNAHGGVDNAFKTMLLEGGMKYHGVGMTSEDSQFIESRKFQVSDIARWYRVPLHMLNELENATFSNIEHQSIEFVMHTIRPWLVRIENTMSRDLLTRQERSRYYIEHNVEGLLRGDSESRFKAYHVAIADGWLNRNEARQKENLNPVEGLDEYLIPLNMAPVGSVSESDNATEIENLVAMEFKALSAESVTRGKTSLNAWAVKFYARHMAKAAARLGVGAEKFADYVANRLNYIENAEDIAATIEQMRGSAVSEMKGAIQ